MSRFHTLDLKKHRVSIIIPCYNQAQYLDEALQSVMDQTYHNWECIIVNDGSTDNTEIVAGRWVNKDTRFKYIYKENGGLSSARNKGLDKATGYYIQFLDSDDTIDKRKFELQLKDLENCEISISDYSPLDDKTAERVDWRYLPPFLNEQDYKKELILDWENKISIPCHSVLFKREILNSYAIRFNESLSNHEDWLFWAKVFYHSKEIQNNPEILAIYRIREASMASDYKLMREGFVYAAQSLVDYFEKINDREFVAYSKLKLKQILERNKKTTSRNRQIINVLRRIIRRLNARLSRMMQIVKLL